MANIVAAGRVGSAAFREALPRIIQRLRAVWSQLPAGVKASAVAAGAAALGMSGLDKAEDMGAVLEEASARDIPTNVNTVSAILSQLPENHVKDMLNAVQTSGPEGRAVVLALEAARSRKSSTAATGDGKTESDTDALAFDRVVARIAIVKRALAALGTTDPRDLRALRDALFMDEQEFVSALERV